MLEVIYILGGVSITSTKISKNFTGILSMTKSNTKAIQLRPITTPTRKNCRKNGGRRSSFEESIQLFEEGMKLSKTCQDALKEAEGKIQKLSEQGDSLVDFEEEAKKITK